MNTYRFNDIEVGKYVEFEVTISEGMMDNFRKLSGDDNPMHTDRMYARSKGMDDRVCYGMLTSSFYSRLVGMYIPGKFCILQEISISFHKPVYIGDCLKISGEVKEKKELFKRLIVNAQIINRNGERVSKAKIKVGCLE